MRVLHVLHHSLPVVDGYSLRTSYIVRNQVAQGLTVECVTSAQHPAAADADVMDGIRIARTPSHRASTWPLLRERGLMAALERSTHAAVERFRPDVIHAHSPVLVGHPALKVARAKRIPFVYEIRDLWENASVDRGRFSERSVWYRLARGFETRVLQRADAVVTICDALRRELTGRVRSADALFIVANGVDTTAFQPLAPSPERVRQWGLEGKEVVGYVGTFQPYEGLDVLIDAMPQLLAERPRAHLVIAGGGEGEAALRERARRTGIDAHVTFTGRVPHDEVRHVYAVADVLVYPRMLTRTTALTTPLKPLEAMAMARAVVVSDVDAMRELVEPDVTGGIFRAGDSGDLARACARLLGDRDTRQRLGLAARARVERDRQWSSNIRQYHRIYERAAVAAGTRGRTDSCT